MKNRTSSSLAFGFTDEGVVGYNFLQKSMFGGEGELIDFLKSGLNWRSFDPNEAAAYSAFIDLGAMVTEGSVQAELEREYVENWKWGLPAALFHFSVQGNDFESLEQGEDKQRASAERLGFPALHLTNRGMQQTVVLESAADHSEQMRLMARRRSVRETANASVSMRSVSRILYSGMGINRFVRNSVTELPLSMTPSGGGRNPYEAYVFARKVEGLEPGIYHYSALEHTLGKLASALPKSLSSIVGNQDWADDMSCIIVLAAFFERTMWKYDDPNAYRVVLIEAGHIGQNMLLMATEEGLSACPTAALSHNPLFEQLELPSRITCAPIYAIAIGAPIAE